MRKLALLFSFLTGLLLLWASVDLPVWRSPDSPANAYLSNQYIEQSYFAGLVPNLVSAILADYRNFDTMFETTVVFTAATAIFLILRQPLAPLAQKRGAGQELPEAQELADDVILQMTCRLMFPPIHLYGLYMLAHGHYSPGGGFQAGVTLAASLILLAIAYDLTTALAFFREKVFLPLTALGAIIYVGTGVLCWLAGGNFLDYQALEAFIPLSATTLRSQGILLVECGVTLTVCTVMFSIYSNLVSRGTQEQGL